MYDSPFEEYDESYEEYISRVDKQQAIDVLSSVLKSSGKAIDLYPLNVQLEIIKLFPSMIRTFDRPFNEVMMAAVDNDPSTIFDMTAPPEEIVVRAIMSATSVISHEKLKKFSFSESTILQLTKHRADYIQLSDSPSRELQEVAISSLCSDRYASGYDTLLSIPSPDLRLDLIKEIPYCLKYLDDQDNDLCLAAIRFNPLWISYIQNPSEDVQLEVLYGNPDILRNIEGWIVDAEDDEYSSYEDFDEDIITSPITVFVNELHQFMSGKPCDFSPWPEVNRVAAICLSLKATSHAEVRMLIDAYRQTGPIENVVENSQLSDEHAVMLMNEEILL